MFDFPPPQVVEVAKQNQITHVRYSDSATTWAASLNAKIYIGKSKNKEFKEECIIEKDNDIHVCTGNEHFLIFLEY